MTILVADIMTRSPITAKPETNLLDCSKKMIKNRIGSLILVNKKKLVGFITNYDILWAIVKKSKESLKDIKAIDISPKKIATIRPTATINDASEKMKRLKFERLPVIQEGELVGVITAKDIISVNPEVYNDMDELSMIREESQKLKRIKGKEMEGICEECGNPGLLYRFNGMLVCESCMNS